MLHCSILAKSFQYHSNRNAINRSDSKLNRARTMLNLRQHSGCTDLALGRGITRRGRYASGGARLSFLGWGKATPFDRAVITKGVRHRDFGRSYCLSGFGIRSRDSKSVRDRLERADLDCHYLWGREMGEVVLSNYLETKAITSRITYVFARTQALLFRRDKLDLQLRARGRQSLDMKRRAGRLIGLGRGTEFGLPHLVHRRKIEIRSHEGSGFDHVAKG